MSLLRHKFEGSPELARVAPFGVYAVLGFFQGTLGTGAMYWFYIAKTLLAAWVIWEVRPFVKEMRWAISWEAVLVGIGIFAIWVGADGLYPRLSDPGKGATPFETFGAGSAMAWSYIAIHIVGMTVIVPPVEEVFYRSFLYRYFVKINFLAMPLNQYHGLSFFVTSALFGLMHPDRWLAGIICGLAYQWLVLRKNRLGDAMTAHGITNCLLGLWIVWKGAWSFW
jgi:uncharacterized protein